MTAAEIAIILVPVAIAAWVFVFWPRLLRRSARRQNERLKRARSAWWDVP